MLPCLSCFIQLPQAVLTKRLEVYDLAGCNATQSFSAIAETICGKMFFTYPHLPTGVGMGDTVDDVEKCVLFDGIGENVVKDIDDARHSNL